MEAHFTQQLVCNILQLLKLSSHSLRSQTNTWKKLKSLHTSTMQVILRTKHVPQWLSSTWKLLKAVLWSFLCQQMQICVVVGHLLHWTLWILHKHYAQLLLPVWVHFWWKISFHLHHQQGITLLYSHNICWIWLFDFMTFPLVQSHGSGCCLIHLRMKTHGWMQQAQAHPQRDFSKNITN